MAKKKGASRPAARPKKPSPQARKAQEAAALRRRLIVAAVLAVVAGVFIFFAARPDSAPTLTEQLVAGSGGCVYDTKFDGDASNQGSHVQNPTYEVDPPAGGPHFPSPANPGFYEGSRVPTDGQLVHAMEHGFVVLWFRPDLPDETRTKIEDLSDQFGRELIVAERDGLDGEVAVTAWHRRLLCDQLVPDKVVLFTRSFKDQGTEKGFL